jgi:catechol 2,3-dioxygenase-like lactoylglutathione lyase family enzyme
MKTHISLNVSNVRASIEFYTKMLGLEPYKVKTDYAKFDVADPPLNLTMNEVNFDKGGALSHLGLQVGSTEDVLAISKRWAENGLVTFEEMNTECCYALQDKIWVADPDGNHWEVFTVLEDSEGVKNPPSVCCAPTVETVSISGSKKAEAGCC